MRCGGLAQSGAAGLEPTSRKLVGVSGNEIQVFRADGEDAEGVASVHAKAFEAAYRDQIPEAVAKVPELEQRIERWQELLEDDGDEAYTLVAEQRGSTVGFLSLATPSHEADADDRTAEIGAFYVAPSRWGNGIGTALMTQALQELREGGWQTVTLWVLVGNEPARTFYARFGFEADGAAGPDALTERPKMRLRASLS